MNKMNEGNNFRFDLWLYNEMQKRGMSILDLAEKADVTEKTIRRFVKNQGLPTMTTLALILDALDCHMEFVSN